MIGRKLPAIDGPLCELTSFQEADHNILWLYHLRLSVELPPGCGARVSVKLLICYRYGVKWNVVE